jgi:hypothetical protein
MPKPETRIVFLQRVRDHGRRQHITLWFQFEGGQPKSSRSRYSFIKPQDMPPFEGDEGWFLIEKAPRGDGHAWPYWRGVREVEGKGG